MCTIEAIFLASDEGLPVYMNLPTTETVTDVSSVGSNSAQSKVTQTAQ